MATYGQKMKLFPEFLMVVTKLQQSPMLKAPRDTNLPEMQDTILTAIGDRIKSEREEVDHCGYNFDYNPFIL
jgi:hypothetical protein